MDSVSGSPVYKRAKLPDSAEKMFDDACTIYFPIQRRVEQDDESWGPLSRRQQREMNEAVRLWEGAAEQGLAEAQCNLGTMYQHGHGVDVNYKKAIEWYEKAAEQGHAGAQYNLGAMYENGDGVGQSDSMAMRWYAKADAQGHEVAQAAIQRLVSKCRGSSTSNGKKKEKKKGEE